MVIVNGNRFSTLINSPFASGGMVNLGGAKLSGNVLSERRHREILGKSCWA